MRKGKKYFAFFYFFIGSFSIQAQYVFDHCSTRAVFGDSLVGTMIEHDTAGITSGNSGANVIWDFSGITSTYTWPLAHYYFDPDSTEGKYMFPTANVADLGLNGVYSYFNYSQDSIAFLGDYHDSVNFHRSWDSQKQIFCSLSFGNSFSDYFSRYNFSQCPYHHTYSNRTITYDGYGTLKVPGYTYSAARLKIVENTVDTAICVGPSIISGTIDTTYLWFDITTGQPVFSWHYYYDTTHSYKNILIEHYLYSHVPLLVASVKDESAMNSQLEIYPNPSNGRFSVEIIGREEVKNNVSIYNSLGEKIFTTEDLDPRSVIDISTNQNGIYFLRMETAKGSFSRKIILSK